MGSFGPKTVFLRAFTVRLVALDAWQVGLFAYSAEGEYSTSDQRGADVKPLSPCHLLSTLVWELRENLNTLIYRLETQALMVAASRTSHVPRASEEVESATDAVTRLESKLMEAAAQAASEHGFQEPCSFQELAEACDAEHDFCLADHRQALVALGGTVTELVATNKEIARKVIQAQSVLTSLEKEADTYSASGNLAPNNRPSIKLDRTV